MKYTLGRKVKAFAGRGSRVYKPSKKRVVCSERPFPDDCPDNGVPCKACGNCPHRKIDKPEMLIPEEKIKPAQTGQLQQDFKESLERLRE